ncbi:hypothetical protein A9Q86_13990 [Flavobacteriales bacterium 33_180_T64]|nr:hypothetical protein A9Q86_13990 [Flavobacteriales bacterium 33_180_T64]
MSYQICIIGCGWLGFPLAKTLIENGYDINGTTTSKNKIEVLKDANINPFLIHFSSERILGDITSCLLHCKTLIINIPPGLAKHPEHNYVQKMKNLISHIEISSIKNVIYIGSTSVYDDNENFPIITEDSPTSNSKNALQLLKVEALFRNNKNFKTTILRFSGLYGEDRHPAKFLSGRKQLKNANAPVNLIHQNDCIAILLAIIKQNIWNTLLNASTVPHPTKNEYYNSVCNRLEIPIPGFEKNEKSKGKIINSEKLVCLLNYKFKVKL